MNTVTKIKLLPTREVVWPEPGKYYAVKGEIKLCVSLNLSTGHVYFQGPIDGPCEMVKLTELGLITEMRVEVC